MTAHFAPFASDATAPATIAASRRAFWPKAWGRWTADWIGPLLIVAALAAASASGMFAQFDGRFFDMVGTRLSPAPPQVVIVRRDARFEQGGAGRFDNLDAALTRMSVERIGYLGAKRPPVTQTSAPVVISAATRPLPAHGLWELDRDAPNPGNALLSARTLAPSQYGIHRSQSAVLPSEGGVVPVFDAALAARYPAGEFLVPLPRHQNVPILEASQITQGEVDRRALAGTVILVASPENLSGSLTTALDPSSASTSEAVYRAHVVQALRTDRHARTASLLETALALGALGLLLALLFRSVDPKRLALVAPLLVSVGVLAASWSAIAIGGVLLPVAALLLAPWIITFVRIIERETVQDRRLERSASQAVQSSLERTALRDAAQLPKSLGSAAQYAGVERSLLLEQTGSGTIEVLAAHNAGIEDIRLPPRELSAILKDVRRTASVREAGAIVPDWPGDVRIGWVGTAKQRLFWLHAREGNFSAPAADNLTRAMATSFHRLSRWREDISRGLQVAGGRSVDDKVSSAVALVASDAAQVRRGFDAIDTAVVVFHLIGAPLHANEAMRALYAEADLDLFDTSLFDALARFTDLEPERIHAIIADLLLNGREMRLPMKDVGRQKGSERLLRIASPGAQNGAADRVLVLEAIDMRDANRAADLRKAVAKFIDLQLRNDFEAIMLGSRLAGDARLGADQVRGVVDQIADTARRATGRLDEVASLVRSESTDILEACYPVNATGIVQDAAARVQGLARDLGVRVDVHHPGVSGFTMAEPGALTDLLVAMLRVVIADTPQGGAVVCRLEEQRNRTLIRISGGFGIGFGRLLHLIANYEEGPAGEYRVIGEGIARVTKWSASVSYWGSEANGFGFNVDLRGVG